MSKAYRIRVDQGEALAKKLAIGLVGGEVFALVGELGSGKTTFTKHLGKALGIKNTITSPTFVIMQEHTTPLKTQKGQPMFFYHLDMYRAISSRNSSSDIAGLGLEQIWNQPNTITVIEWADKIKPLLPAKTAFIYFSPNLNVQNPEKKTE
jgi:tRNA threonylcarbamoyladenosine biosynthesis protein TsaE